MSENIKTESEITNNNNQLFDAAIEILDKEYKSDMPKTAKIITITKLMNLLFVNSGEDVPDEVSGPNLGELTSRVELLESALDELGDIVKECFATTGSNQENITNENLEPKSVPVVPVQDMVWDKVEKAKVVNLMDKKAKPTLIENTPEQSSKKIKNLLPEGKQIESLPAGAMAKLKEFRTKPQTPKPNVGRSNTIGIFN